VALHIGLQKWLLAQTSVLLSRAFQGMAQWFQSVADCMLVACACLEEAWLTGTGHRTGGYAPAQVSGMGSSGSLWAKMPHLRLV